MTATYDLFAAAPCPVELAAPSRRKFRDREQASDLIVDTPGPRPPALLWGWCWRLALVEAGSLALLGDLAAGVPRDAAVWACMALAALAWPIRPWRRWGLLGALWRAAASTVALTLASGHRVLPAVLFAAAAVCLAEPIAQRFHRAAA